MKLPIYLDYSATTPVDPRVLEEMLPYLSVHFGNPASRSHSHGWTAEDAVELAREQVARCISADPREIIWTSGATESNNIAIKGAARFYKSRGAHIVTCETEHKAVIDCCRFLEKEGFSVTYLPTQTNGIIDLDQFSAAIRSDTVLASIMYVNNEIGVIQPIAEIAQICQSKGVIFHVDAAQAVGKIPVNIQELCVDLMSLSAHKAYGPKGIGALYVRRKPRIRLAPLIHGGGHERGLRSGTLPTHQIVGMGRAYEICNSDEVLLHERARIKKLCDNLIAGLSDMDAVFFNGDLVKRVPHNLNVSFNYVEGESLMMAIKDISVSSGSACTSASLEPSYVLRALGRSDELAHSSIRFSFGRFTTQEEIDFTIALLHQKVEKLRNLSPLWEMYCKGIDVSAFDWSSKTHTETMIT